MLLQGAWRGCRLLLHDPVKTDEQRLEVLTLDSVLGAYLCARHLLQRPGGGLATCWQRSYVGGWFPPLGWEENVKRPPRSLLTGKDRAPGGLRITPAETRKLNEVLMRMFKPLAYEDTILSTDRRVHWVVLAVLPLYIFYFV